MTPPPAAPAPVAIRRATPADIEPCAQICYEAFAAVNAQHNFPPDFPGPDVAKQVMAMMFAHPGFYCVLAEQNGRIIGSNCLDERTSIAGVGPITVGPMSQNVGARRQPSLAV